MSFAVEYRQAKADAHRFEFVAYTACGLLGVGLAALVSAGILAWSHDDGFHPRAVAAVSSTPPPVVEVTAFTEREACDMRLDAVFALAELSGRKQAASKEQPEKIRRDLGGAKGVQVCDTMADAVMMQMEISREVWR